jgi:hypothetical protein
VIDALVEDERDVVLVVSGRGDYLAVVLKKAFNFGESLKGR